MLGALMDPSAQNPAAPPPASARPVFRTMMAGGLEAPPGLPASPPAPVAAAPPPASSTIGLSASPMSTPGTRIPDEGVAPGAPTAVPPAAAVVPVAPPVAPVPAPAPPAAAPAAPVAPALAPVAAAPVAAPRSKEGMRTMIGVGLNPVPAAAPIAPAATAAAPAGSTPVAPVQPPVDSSAPPLGDTVVDPPRPAAAQPHRTMLGMPMPVVAASPASPAAATASPGPPPAAPAPPPAAAPSPIGASVEARPQAPAPAAMPEALPKRNIGPSNRTMLGVAAPVVARGATPASVPDPTPPPAPPAVYETMPRAETSSMDVSIAGMPSPRRRLRGWLIALLVLGVLLVGSVISAALYYRVTRTRVDVAALVSAGTSGEVLGVDVARAPEGTRARFGTAVQPLAGTHVEFPLAADTLHVGDNVVDIDVLFADGSTETHAVTLTVEYRVRADLATLTATPPAITVVVDALPGSTVVLDAQPLTLDARGHGTRAYPISSIAPDATGTLALTAHYTITPPAPAAAATGTLSSRVPATTLRLERPADAATTDQASIVVGGVTQAGATVTVEGSPATVSSDGHFSFTAPLASVGARELHVSASAPGRAPASAVIHVERVADLGRAAAAFTVDRTLTYARLAAAPASFQGQHVAIEGRVYNVDLQDGHGVLQMLARDCPAGQRCPLWVTHPAISEITVESWVRVVGTVAGEQQFMSQSGEVRTVPRVDAAFVLPSHP